MFHFIDAKDSPPYNCTVDLDRDCKEEGCVVTAIGNYTSQILDPSIPAWLRAQAAKFVIHFVSDIHQPLHDEDVSKGGNGIQVLFEGSELNLHHVWDSSIAEKWVGGIKKKPYPEAREWAGNITDKIRHGDFKAQSQKWLDGVDFADPNATALAWAREGNAYVCSHGKYPMLLSSHVPNLLMFAGVLHRLLRQNDSILSRSSYFSVASLRTVMHKLTVCV